MAAATDPDHAPADVLIVGAGIFGTSTAYWLSLVSPGTSVAVVDRTPFPPTHAASTDINKIIREDYSVPFYMQLAAEAMEAWKGWPDLAGKGFYHRTGWINFNARGSDLSARIRANFAARGRDPTVDMTLEQARAKFGGLFTDADLSECDGAYCNPDAGWCDAGAATAELMQRAVERGVRYVQANVEQLVHDDQNNRVLGIRTTDGSVLTAHKILLASGAWTSSLMSPLEDELHLAAADRVERQVTAAGVCVAHYALSEAEYVHLSTNMPVTIYAHHGDAQPPPAASRLLKFTNANSFVNTITTPSGARISVPPARPQDVVSQKLKDETYQVITGRLMPRFTDRPVDRWRLCWDSITPSQDHLIARHPDPRLSNLYLAVGGSLHSYKFLPTIGKYVVNVLNGTSNGPAEDQHWAWKSPGSVGAAAHEKAYPTRELCDLDD